MPEGLISIVDSYNAVTAEHVVRTGALVTNFNNQISSIRLSYN